MTHQFNIKSPYIVSELLPNCELGADAQLSGLQEFQRLDHILKPPIWSGEPLCGYYANYVSYNMCMRITFMDRN